jgi:hypothetical protein
VDSSGEHRGEREKTPRPQQVGQRPATEDEIRRAEAGRSPNIPRKRRSWRFWKRKGELTR